MSETKKPNEKSDVPSAPNTPFPSEMLGETKVSIERVLTETEAKQTYGFIRNESEFRRNAFIRSLATKKGVPPERILAELRLFAKQLIRSVEKGRLYHFHRTSFDNLPIIAKYGRLLSRTKIKELEPDLPLSAWSASDDVMMTRDKYTGEGTLYQPGFQEIEAVGAAGRGAMFVFDENVMDLEDYDATLLHPRAPDIPLAQCCTAVLVAFPEDIELVRGILSQYGLGHISVQLKSEWKR